MGRPAVSVAPCGLIQVIRLHWGKTARGGQGARNRSSVPLAFKVPADHLLNTSGQLHVEESHWGDNNAFAKPFHHRHQRVPLASGYSFGCVTVTVHPDGLLVRYQWDESRGGAPDRSFVNFVGNTESVSRDLLVMPGKWVRVCYNGRFSCVDSGNWWYEQVTVNVALFGVKPSGQVFVRSESARELKMIADLW